MADTFIAQSLVETRRVINERRFEMTFVDADGQCQTISLPVGVAADLAPVLQALAPQGAPRKMEFTRIPKSTAVGSARQERLVLIRFDDEPPYGLEAKEAESLWREVREEAEYVFRLRAPAQQ
jgi:hypothetical protein